MKTNKANQIVSNALNSLISSVEEGQSQVLQNYLKTMSHFHNYSFRNILLISMQNHKATHVAGFHTWKKLGRYVKKGEKGIAIIAPLVYKKKNNEEKSDDDIRDIFFKVVYVFDIAQTDGADLPKLTRAEGDPSRYSQKLNDLITGLKIKLKYTKRLGSDGLSTGGKILIRQGLTPAYDFSVRVHELAHELLHKKSDLKLTKNQKESEAEAVAYVVCETIGLDTNCSASDYIQLYDGDKNILIKSFQRIQSTSKLILEGIEYKFV